MNNFCDSCSKNVTFKKQKTNYCCSECGTIFEKETVKKTCESSGKNKKRVKAAILKRPDVSLTSFEVYELILFGWLKKLKKLGLSNDFCKCVRDLWANYYARIIKRNENGQIEMVLTPNFAKRDLEIMVGKKYKRNNPKNLLSNKRFKKSNEMNGELDKKVNGGFRSEEDADSDDENMKEDNEDDEEIDDDDDDAVEKRNENENEEDEDLIEPTKYSKTSSTFIQGMLRMTKHKLLSFLSLGLILTREKFLVSELTIAISNGSIPFQDVSMFLPSNEARDIIFTYMLLHDFRYTHVKMSFMTRKLIDFIGLEGVTEYDGLDTLDILERFTKIYHLPKKIIGYIVKLIELIPPVREQLPGFLWNRSREVFCFAFVIFMLKLLFFLDDYHEYVLHEFTEKYDREFFSFVKWTQFLMFRRAFFVQYPKFKECNASDEKLCEYLFWQTKENEDFDLDAFFRNQNVDFNEEAVFEVPDFKSFEDLSLNYILEPEKYEEEFESVILTKPYKRKIKHIRNVENLSGGPKPLTETVPKYVSFDYVNNKKSVRALVSTFRKNKKNKFNAAFNQNFHISKSQLKKSMDKKKAGRRKKGTQPQFKTIFDSQNYWFKSLDFHKKKVFCSSEEFNKSTLPKFPKSFAFLLAEFAKFSQCNPSFVYIYFEKIELRFVDFKVNPEDNSCKSNYLRHLLSFKW